MPLDAARLTRVCRRLCRVLSRAFLPQLIHRRRRLAASWQWLGVLPWNAVGTLALRKQASLSFAFRHVVVVLAWCEGKSHLHECFVEGRGRGAAAQAAIARLATVVQVEAHGFDVM